MKTVSRKRILLWVLILGVIGVFAAWQFGIFGKKTSGHNQETKTQSNSPKPLPVLATVANPVLIQNTILTNGTILADESVSLTAEVSGIVESIFFQESSPVQKGDRLFKINDEEFQAEKKVLEHRLELAQTQENRLKALFDKEAVSLDEFQRARTERLTLEAQLAQIEVRIGKTSVLAPFSGLVGLRTISPGAMVAVGMELTTLVKTDYLKIEFSVPGRYSDAMKPGRQILFYREGGKSGQATIYAVDPVMDQVTRTLRGRARFANLDFEFIPGQFVHINLVLEEKQEAISIPSEALVPELGKTKVFIFNDGKAVFSEVQTGIRSSTHVEIVSGLNPGDTVIVSGAMQLRPEMPVSITIVKGEEQ